MMRLDSSPPDRFGHILDSVREGEVPHTRSLWIVIAAASQLFDSSTHAREAALSAPDAVYRAEQRPPSMWVEFDLPEGFWDRLDDASYLVTGIRLGYFRTNGNLPLLERDFDRTAITVIRRRAGRIPLDVEWLAASRERLVVRLRTLTRDDWTDWSEPSETILIEGQVDASTEQPAGIRAER